jgi:uncharacterized protein (TIGR02271 family)
MADQAMNRPSEPLVRLDEAPDYQIASGNPDPRGWDVRSGGTTVGTVDHLIADLSARKVRYLVVKLDRDVAGTREDRHVLIPIGAARLDDEADQVNLTGVTPAQLASLPPYRPGEPISREYELALRQGLTGRQTAAGDVEQEYYTGEQFDEGRFFGRRGPGPERVVHIPRSEEELAVGKRAVQAGEVEVRKRVETEHMQQPVTRMREEVDVERTPHEEGDRSTQPVEGQFHEGEVRIPIMEEEVVVEKRPVVREDVVIRKRAVEDTENVEADVRKERVDVEQSGEGGESRGKRAARRRDPEGGREER